MKLKPEQKKRLIAVLEKIDIGKLATADAAIRAVLELSEVNRDNTRALIDLGNLVADLRNAYQLPPRPYATAAEVAKLTGLSLRAVRYHIKEGKIPTTPGGHIPRKWLQERLTALRAGQS